jgi:hypothetical protein
MALKCKAKTMVVSTVPDPDALLYNARKSEKDILLKDCGEILKRVKKLALCAAGRPRKTQKK